MTKRLLSWLLVFVMVLGMLPTAAFAAETGDGAEAVETPVVEENLPESTTESQPDTEPDAEPDTEPEETQAGSGCGGGGEDGGCHQHRKAPGPGGRTPGGNIRRGGCLGGAAVSGTAGECREADRCRGAGWPGPVLLHGPLCVKGKGAAGKKLRRPLWVIGPE